MTQTISAKLPKDLVDRIEEVQEEGESRSAAVRRLIRAGLDQRHSGIYLSRPAAIFMIGWYCVIGAFVEVKAVMGYFGLFLFVAAIAAEIAERREWI